MLHYEFPFTSRMIIETRHLLKKSKPERCGIKKLLHDSMFLRHFHRDAEQIEAGRF